MSDLFTESLTSLGISLNDNQIQQFNKYYEMLIEKNKVMNLTAITEYEDVVIKHFADSLSIVNVDIFKKKLSTGGQKNVKVIDMGTGAGFPGIPLKIAFPELEITLMDSLNKRIVFLNDVIKELGLTKITAIHGRAEEAARKEEYREQYDFAVSRAVAKLNSLSEFCLPFVKKDGYFIPYKSGDIADEMEVGLKAVTTLGGKVEDTINFTLPHSDFNRSLIVIHKVKNTPPAYPRGGGKVLSKPL